jgi:hypothetical protein
MKWFVCLFSLNVGQVLSQPANLCINHKFEPTSVWVHLRLRDRYLHTYEEDLGSKHKCRDYFTKEI